MPEISRGTLLDGWVQECGKGFPFPGPDYFARIVPFFNADWTYRNVFRQFNGAPDEERESLARAEVERLRIESERENPSYLLRVTESGALIVQREKGRNRAIVEMARYNGLRDKPRGIAILNGDGFDEQILEGLQTDLRDRIRGAFRRNAQRMIVPYAAMTAAQLDLASVNPIHIAGDRQTTVPVKVLKPPEKVLDAQRKEVHKDHRRTTFEHGGRQYTCGWDYYRGNTFHPQGFHNFNILHTAEFSNRENWHVITEHEDGTWWVNEQVHRLGSAVFWASGPDGVRHRWLSSFDQNEQPPMYFLAQLPDKGAIRYVTHAIRLLAPEIVQKARADGRRVFRQGDIFAVETDLTDDDFSPSVVVARSRVIGEDGFVLAQNNLTPEGRRNIRLRRRVMIYGTGHTATRVAVTKTGTFIQGTMHHDPILENIRGNRQPDHRALELTANKWFLCVRNTVPRLNTDQGGSNATVETVPDVPHDEHRNGRGVSEPELPGRSGSSNGGSVTPDREGDREYAI